MRRPVVSEPPSPPEWELVPEGWNYARKHTEVRGWNVPDVLNEYERKWPRFVLAMGGNGPLGVAHESDLTTNDDIGAHNTLVSFAYALALAASGRTQVSLLDWGGGIGHYYLVAKAVIPGVKIDYHCKDVPVLAEAGAQKFPEARFYVDESCLLRQYDFVLASTSLHYSEDWPALLRGLAKATRGYLFVTRVPTVLHVPSFVFIQRPYAYGYSTEYLGWCLNRTLFLNEATVAGLELVREFIIDERPAIARAPERCQYRGFLFRGLPVRGQGTEQGQCLSRDA